MTIGKRLAEERKKSGFSRQEQLGKKIDVSFTTISRWEKEESPIPSDKLLMMSDLGLDIIYILFGKVRDVADIEKNKINKNKKIIPSARDVADFAPAEDVVLNPNDYAWMPLYNVEVSAGDGRFTDQENILTYFSMTKYSLRKRGLTDFKQLGFVIVHGDSMFDTLHPDDCIMINFAKTKPDGGIFVLRVGGAFHVKRLILEKDSVRVISDNERYREWSLGSNDDFEIIGKYEWHARYAA